MLKKFIALVTLVSSLSCASGGDILVTTVKDYALSIPMFDYSYEPSKGTELTFALSHLKERLNKMGFKVDIVPDLPAYGLTYKREHLILVTDGLDPNGEFEVLAHEAGHLFHPTQMDRAFSEAFAEMVAVRLAAEWGFDSTVQAGAYLNQYREGLETMVLYDREIRYATSVLRGKKEIPKWLKPPSQENRSQD